MSGPYALLRAVAVALAIALAVATGSAQGVLRMPGEQIATPVTRSTNRAVVFEALVDLCLRGAASA